MPSAMHRLLLRVAGQTPAALLGTARAWLADGEVTEVGRALAFAALARQISLADADARLVAGVLTAAGAPGDLLADLPRSGNDPTPPYTWTPGRPTGPGPAGRSAPPAAEPHEQVALSDVERTDALAAPGAMSGVHRLDRPAAPGVDPVDRAAVAALIDPDGDAHPVGLWRVWRRPAPATPYPPAVRVYLAQTRAGAVALTARLQAALVAVGEADPLVEVFGHLAGLPAYQRRALDRAVLLWAARPAEPVRIAATFDLLDASGNPAFGPDRVRLSSTEANRVAGYLAAGVRLVTSAVRVPDVIVPERTVPLDLCGDGRWVWSAATAHYLTRYRIAPDEGLLAAIRAAGYAPPDVDAVAVHRSRAALPEVTGTRAGVTRPGGRAAG